MAPKQFLPSSSPPVVPPSEVPSPSEVVQLIGDEATLPSSGSLPEMLPPEFLLPVVDPTHYAVEGELAHGGIGRILRAWDLRLGRPVALKQMLSPSPEAESRFRTEALVTARLQHPAIIPVYEAGRWPDGELFFAMKLVSGRSLADVLAEGRPLEERLALLPHVVAVAEAMAYAHSERIIHRDLKPANVLVGGFGETVVIDWGLAKDLSRAENTGAPDAFVSEGASLDGCQTRLGTVMGTPAYMPPEQAAGQSVDERADVYSLGAILYHLLAGARPYEGDTSDQVLARVMSGPPAQLASLQGYIPRDLLAIVTKDSGIWTGARATTRTRAMGTSWNCAIRLWATWWPAATRRMAACCSGTDKRESRAASSRVIKAMSWASPSRLRGRESRALRGHTGQVGAVAFFPEGKTLASTGQDGSIRLWPDDLPLEPEALRAWLSTSTSDEPPSANTQH